MKCFECFHLRRAPTAPDLLRQAAAIENKQDKAGSVSKYQIQLIAETHSKSYDSVDMKMIKDMARSMGLEVEE